MTDFLSRIAQSPGDESLRLVYADALEEQGQVTRGEYLRLEVQWCRVAHERERGWSTVLVRESTQFRIGSIKAIRELTGLGLKDSKDLSDAVMAGRPAVITRDRTRAEAEADALWHRQVEGVEVEVRLEGRERLPSEVVWERLLALSTQLDPQWLRSLNRLWAVTLLRAPDEAAGERLLAHALRTNGTCALTTGQVDSGLPRAPGRLRDGLTREVAEALVASEASGLLGLERSRCFFDWPVGVLLP